MSVNPLAQRAAGGRFLAGRLKQFGFETEVVTVAKNRANVIAVIRGAGEAPAIMFNGHLDVVPAGDQSAWARDPFCGDIADGKIWGRGSSDMKGGVAAMCVAAALLGASKPRLKGDLMVTAVSDEESNSIGARHYVEHNSLDNIGAVVIPESTNLDIVIAEKGTLWYEVHHIREDRPQHAAGDRRERRGSHMRSSLRSRRSGMRYLTRATSTSRPLHKHRDHKRGGV
jgi:succinyl-diaminopimelate desuccinylase